MCNDSCLYTLDKTERAHRSKAMIYTLLKNQPEKSVTAFRTRLEYLFLKCSLLLSDDEIGVLCRTADLDAKKVLRLVHTARQLHCRKIERLAALEEKRNVLWLRLRNFELQYHVADDEIKRGVIGQKLVYARTLYTNAVRRIEKFRPLLSNRETAELLNIPKPTVDSGLLRLQKMVMNELPA